MKLFDTHTHVMSDHDHPVILVTSAPDDWAQILDFSTKHKQTFAALGIHPWMAQKDDLDIDLLVRDLNHQVTNYRNQIYAIGEIGLDFYKGKIAEERERHMFIQQLELAAHFQLPVLLHVRQAHQDVIKILKKYRGKLKGTVHAYSGSFEEAKEYVGLGFKLGLGPSLLKKQSIKIRKIAQDLDLNSFVLETDAPYMKGELKDILQTLAELRMPAYPQENLEYISETIYKNSCLLLGIE